MDDKLGHAQAILRILERERMMGEKLYLEQTSNRSGDPVYLEQSPSRDERLSPGRFVHSRPGEPQPPETEWT